MSSIEQHVGTGSGLIGSVTMITGGVGGAVLIVLGADKSVIIGITGLLLMLFLSLCSAMYIYRQSKDASQH